MRTVFFVVLWSVLCSSVIAAVDRSIAVLPRADSVALLKGADSGLVSSLSSLGLVPPSSLKVLSEQCEAFAKDTGFNPLDINLICVQGERSTSRFLVMIRAKYDFKKLKETIMAQLSGSKTAASLEIKDEPGRLTFLSKDRSTKAVLTNDGEILAGAAASVDEIGRGTQADQSGLIRTLASRLGDGSGLVLGALFPRGIEAQLPPQAAPFFPEGVLGTRSELHWDRQRQPDEHHVGL